jgi:hypothetical protein
LTQSTHQKTSYSINFSLVSESLERADSDDREMTVAHLHSERVLRARKKLDAVTDRFKSLDGPLIKPVKAFKTDALGSSSHNLVCLDSGCTDPVRPETEKVR